MSTDNLRFLTYENLEQIKIDFGTPAFVYDENTLRANAKLVKSFPNAFGLFPRYAMKAAPTAAILRIFNDEGLGIDAVPFLKSKEPSVLDTERS